MRARLFLFGFALVFASACSSSPSSSGLPDADVPDGDLPDADPTDGGSGEIVIPDPTPRDPALYRHPQDDVLRINQVQVKATHNSYHIAPSDMTIPDWSYTHAPLDEQFEVQGVRGVELDLYWDPSNERYRVLHLPVIDPKTTCETFVECLLTMRDWSDANPGHHPIFVQIEPKSTITETDREARFDTLDAEIRSVFPSWMLVTPDDVRGDEDSLGEALAVRGWPTLGESRGRFLFYFDCSRELALAYAGPEGKLEGRVMFPDSRASDPFAGFMVINSPGQSARDAVDAGYLVRVFAENLARLITDGEPAEYGIDRLEAALDSGAHVISTDVPVPRDDLDYVTEIPGGTPSRCNPRTTTPGDCASLDIEDPELIAR